MTIQVDTATSGPWDALGELIVKAGKEDASGYRRYLAGMLANRELEGLARQLGITVEEAEGLRSKFVEAYGEPNAAAGAPPEAATAR